MSESLQLGGLTGAIVGAAAVTAGRAGSDGVGRTKAIVIGAELGSLAGLTMSYFLHRAAENSRRLDAEDEIEMHFGDLPPNPFVTDDRKSRMGGG